MLSKPSMLETIGSRLIGRVFTYEDALHFVREVDEQTGLAGVSFRKDGETAFISMPLREVALRLNSMLQS